MKMVICPYCFEAVPVEEYILEYLDDGSTSAFTYDCPMCEKVFNLTVRVEHLLFAKKLPCANGEDHCLEDYKILPPELGVGKKRCKWCGTIVLIDPVANQLALEKYLNELKC
ncbi:MAG: hypothetical protein OQK82_06900 [Candidatus Pacearchaeota archaeon]|nr:hypothetical protein [Candidatus Pacearchaeota archaeon]